MCKTHFIPNGRLCFNSLLLRVGLKSKQPTVDHKMFSVHLGLSVVKSGEGYGTPLQYSWLENPMDGGV